MAYSEFTVTNDWPDTATYTASGATACEVHVETVTELRIAFNATKPTAAARLFKRVKGGTSAAFELADGDKIWLAAPNLKGSATVDVVMTHGAA